MEAEGCLAALAMAVKMGYKPQILNSDQGPQHLA